MVMFASKIPKNTVYQGIKFRFAHLAKLGQPVIEVGSAEQNLSVDPVAGEGTLWIGEPRSQSSYREARISRRCP